MKTKNEIKKIAKQTLSNEASALKNAVHYVSDSFADAVQLIFRSKGRVVVTGIGKSAIIAQKMVATFNSTGTPAIFMHAGDAIHGDLGIIQKQDVVICVSKSGNTPEIKVLVPLLKAGKNKLIAMVGNVKSFLALQSDYIINCTIEKEACPNDLAPTTSTTVQLAMGDAMAVSLLSCRSFSAKDFAKYHPGGSLGKKLYLKVNDISNNNLKPFVSPSDNLKSVILNISSNRLGATAVVEKGSVKGVITDGDLRRMLEKKNDISKIKAADIMNKTPKIIDGSAMAVDALKLLKQHNISQLIVVNQKKYSGILHFHDLIKEGII